MLTGKGEEGGRRKRVWWIERRWLTYFSGSIYTLCSKTPFPIDEHSMEFWIGGDSPRPGYCMRYDAK